MSDRGYKFERTDIWREGKWIDLWSVVHFLTGISLGLGISIFKFGALASIVIVFLLLVAYELWEAMVRIEETPQNRVMDVIVGMTSFLPTFFFVAPIFSLPYFLIVFAVSLSINSMVATTGWLESRKADELEARFRLEVAEQRRRFQARRARFMANRERRRLRRAQRRQHS